MQTNGRKVCFREKKKALKMFANLLIFNALDCGVRGIRTPEPLLTTTRFPGVPLQPLEHHSFIRYKKASRR